MHDLRYALLLSVAVIAAVPGAAIALPIPTFRLDCYTQLEDGRIVDLSALCSAERRPSRVPATLDEAALEADQERARMEAEIFSQPEDLDPVSKVLRAVPDLWR